MTRSTRHHVRGCVLKAGRWLQVEHPTIAEPAAWTRDLCAAYVAAIDRMRVGDFAQRRTPVRDRLGQPLSARSKDGYLGAARQFFRDCQEWGWIPRRFDLGHGYCTYNFFEQCPHRMACARGDVYLPKASAHAHLLEAKGHLQRMFMTIPVTEPERAAVEDRAAAVEQLLTRLADTPTPAGPTPRAGGNPDPPDHHPLRQPQGG